MVVLCFPVMSLRQRKPPRAEHTARRTHPRRTPPHACTTRGVAAEARPSTPAPPWQVVRTQAPWPQAPPTVRTPTPAATSCEGMIESWLTSS